MVQGRVQFPRHAQVSQVPDVPNVNTVVVVDTGQPVVGGVIGHGHRVWVASLGPAGEQLTVGVTQMWLNSSWGSVAPDTFIQSHLASDMLEISAPR